jgi:hypothetical protein
MKREILFLNLTIVETIFLLVFIVFIAGCVTEFQGLIMNTGYTSVEDLGVGVEAIPDEVFSNRGTTIFFDVENNGDVDLNDVEFMVTDPCMLSDSTGTKEIGKLEPDEVYSWSWDYTVGEVREEKTCDVRFRTQYDSSATALYDIAVISEDEYRRLLEGDRLSQEIPLNYFKTKTPIDIHISLSKQQPILEEMEFYLHLKLKDAGGGMTENQIIEKNDLTLEYPDFLELQECDDLSESGGVLKLNRDLPFLDKETKIITCKFKPQQVGIKKTGHFKVEVFYKYILDNSIQVKVIPI